MKNLGVYAAIVSGFFFIGFVMGSAAESAGRIRPAFYEWNLFVMGFVGIAFLMFGFSVLSYLNRKDRRDVRKGGNVWE
jgi:hypothetical protein